MLLVARKNLFAEKVRLAISVGGVALSVFLIGVLLSLFRGWNEQVGGFVERVPADFWLASDGATDFSFAASILPADLGDELAKREEVQTVSPLIVRPMEVWKGGEGEKDKFDLQLVGYDPKIGVGGPLKVVEGKSPPGPDDIIIDKRMSERYDVHIGDELVRGSQRLFVVGYSTGGDFVYTQVGFVTLDTAVSFLELDPPDQRTFFVLKLEEGAAKEMFAARLRVGVPGLKVIDPHAFAQDTRDRILGNILPILIVIVTIAFIVGLAVAGLTIYTATVEKSREYGILKAEGFTNPFLYRVVFEQSLITGCLGFILGAGLTLLVAPFAEDAVAQFVVYIRWQDLMGVAGATIIMSLLASYIPMRRLTTIDPVSVFKG